MAVTVSNTPWEFTAQGDTFVPDSNTYGPHVGVGINPYIDRLILVVAAAGTFDVRDKLDGQTLTGLVTVSGAGAPIVIELKRQVRGIHIQALTGTGNKVLVYAGWE